MRQADQPEEMGQASGKVWEERNSKRATADQANHNVVIDSTNSKGLEDPRTIVESDPISAISNFSTKD